MTAISHNRNNMRDNTFMHIQDDIVAAEHLDLPVYHAERLSPSLLLQGRSSAW
jgi:hypothetical protein